MNFSDKQFLILLAVGGAAFLYARGTLKSAANAVNPLNQDNVISGSANEVTRQLTGRTTDKFGRPLTLGAWLAGG